MKLLYKIIKILILGLLIVGIGLNYYNTNLMQQKLKKPTYKYLKSVTVYIIGETEQNNKLNGCLGTGIIIQQKRGKTYILTNKHVAGDLIKEKYNLYVKYNNNRYLAKIIAFDSNFDLAIITVPFIFDDKQVIKGISDISIQDKIYLVGQHLGMLYIYGEGVYVGNHEKCGIIQCPVASGNSGSGVFDKNGKLIGLLYAVHRINYFDLDLTQGIIIKSYDIKLFVNSILKRINNEVFN